MNLELNENNQRLTGDLEDWPKIMSQRSQAFRGSGNERVADLLDDAAVTTSEAVAGASKISGRVLNK